ncbi:unnamed protein product, partial [Cladocopium goreaui]
ADEQPNGPRWKPEFGGQSHLSHPSGSLPGDWNAGVHAVPREESDSRPKVVSKDFQAILDSLVARHLHEVAEIQAENADLRARFLETKPIKVLRTLKEHVHFPGEDETEKVSDALDTSKVLSRLSKLTNESEKVNEKPELTNFQRLQLFLQSSTFDAIISAVLFTNVMLLGLQLQFEGSRIGYSIAYYPEKVPADRDWPGIQEGLHIADHLFTVIFTADVVLRIACLKCSFWKSPMNWIDTGVVVLTLATVFLDMSSLPIDPIFLRLLRLGKLARAFRMIILSGRLESFGLLLKCVLASVTMLGYATLVLIFVQCVCGMIISTLVSRYLEDPAMDAEGRRHVFQYWGTFTRTFLTMFEVLFANWAPSCRALVDNVSEWFTLIFVAYRCIVGFALLNVVNSVFVSQTLKIADSDEEYLIKLRQKHQDQYRKKLETLFKAADVTNDGFLELDEFMRLLEDEKMHLWLSQLQLEYHDLMELFQMIDSGDGRIDWKEFMEGAGRLKGQAKSMDVFRLETKIDAVMKSLNDKDGSKQRWKRNISLDSS